MSWYVTMSVLWLQSSLLRTRPVWRGVTSCGGVLQSCYRPAVTRSHYIVTHLTHYTSVYLPWDFINWGGGGFHVFFGPLSVSRWRWTMMVGQILDGKSMTLLTLPRCGLMLMWLLLTAGTFDTICPWTIQHEQWLFSSKRVTSHRLDCSIVFPSVLGWRNGGRRTRLEAGVNIWLFVIIYIWVKFDIPRKGSWWAPIWPLTAPLAA